LETLEIANNLAEKMRSSYLSEGSKLIITGLARTGFDRTIQAAHNLYNLTGDASYANAAFISAEKSKSSVLLASLQEVERKKNLAIPAEMQELERNIKKETEILKRKLYVESQRPEYDQYKVEKWQEQLFYLSQQLDSIDNEIRERFPEYAAKYDNEVIDLNGIRAKLADDEVLLEYSLCDTCLYIFMVGRDDFRIERFSIDSTFHHDVAVLSQFLRNNDFSRGTYDDYLAYVNVATDIYNILLKPVEVYIEGKKLLIIPDGDMGYIPFEALLTEKPENERMDYRSLPYLLYKYRTNYAYSATLYFSEDTDRKKTEKTLLAFAPTYENIGEINSDKFPTYRDYSTYLVPLRYISIEIGNISEIVDADRFEAYEATEKAFKENAPDYNILHLAMHTLLNDENPLYSKLVFTMNNDTLEENDGLLHAYEIFNMQLNAQMAVLSACNTGYGKLQKGEGIMSMARGFIFAGVPSIIMTLWAVEDQSGSILMSKFYSNLVQGMEIDEALQEAKLQYLKEADQLGAHPYLWSGYVSIGSTDALITTSWSNVFIISGSALILILLIVFIIFWVSSSRKRA
jgi:CHAT domain-containing protein